MSKAQPQPLPPRSRGSNPGKSSPNPDHVHLTTTASVAFQMTLAPLTESACCHPSRCNLRRHPGQCQNHRTSSFCRRPWEMPIAASSFPHRGWPLCQSPPRRLRVDCHFACARRLVLSLSRSPTREVFRPCHKPPRRDAARIAARFKPQWSGNVLILSPSAVQAVDAVRVTPLVLGGFT